MTNSQKVTLVYNYDSEVVESAKVPSRNIIANSWYLYIESSNCRHISAPIRRISDH